MDAPTRGDYHRRMPVPITDEQAAQLNAKVQALLSDKTAADSATAASNQAMSALTTAQQAAADANVAEATADGKVTADLQDLLSFVGSITGTTITSTPVTP